MSNAENFFEWFNEFSPEFERLTGEKMDANHCLSSWNAAVKSLSPLVLCESPRRPGKATSRKMLALTNSLQRLIEVYDDPTGKQWTTTSKREAIEKAREAINLALGE